MRDEEEKMLDSKWPKIRFWLGIIPAKKRKLDAVRSNKKNIISQKHNLQNKLNAFRVDLNEFAQNWESMTNVENTYNTLYSRGLNISKDIDNLYYRDHNAVDIFYSENTVI